MKLFHRVSIIVIAFFTLIITGVSASGIKNIANVNIQKDSTAQIINLSGTTEAGNAKQVTVQVLEPNGELDYINQVTSNAKSQVEERGFSY